MKPNSEEKKNENSFSNYLVRLWLNNFIERDGAGLNVTLFIFVTLEDGNKSSIGFS